MRTPMPLPDQIDAMRTHLRTIRAVMNRAYREGAARYRKRKICPFVESLSNRRASQAFELHDIGEECMRQLRQAQALSIAGFFPGTQITVEVIVKGHERPATRAVIQDVEWSRPSGCRYIAWDLTMAGQLFKRGPKWLCPSSRIRITRCDVLLPEETRRECEHWEESARRFISQVTTKGGLDEIVKRVQERRERRGY